MSMQSIQMKIIKDKDQIMWKNISKTSMNLRIH